MIETARVRKLEEAWKTRKELKEFFSEEKKPAASAKTTGRKWEWN
jgi:hypothetical protein